MRYLTRTLLALLPLPILAGCFGNHMPVVKESRTDTEVLNAARDSIKARYYQVKVYESSRHIIALTPIRVEGNQPVRKRIDVYVFVENGYWTPKVWVRQYADLAEPPMEKGGPIMGRFPIEVTDPAPVSEDWHPLFYDRTEEEALRTDILKRLNIPS